MNWEAIGAIGEILGATVVFITLAYLAIQVRYAKIAASDANRQVRTRGITDMQLAMLPNSEALSAFARANQADDYYQTLAREFSLDYDEALQVDSMCLYWFWLHWGQFSSLTTQEDIAELSQTVGKFYQLPALQYSWRNSPFAKQLFEQKYIEFVEESVARYSA
jgi:hypothetical protein